MWDCIEIFKNCLYLSGWSVDWNILRNFHQHFERSHKSRRTKYTCPHELEETLHDYEYAMRIWEEKTRLLYLGQATDPERTFDEILERMTPDEDYCYSDFLQRLKPRVRAISQAAPPT